jgi:hypothetical protein
VSAQREGMTNSPDIITFGSDQPSRFRRFLTPILIAAGTPALRVATQSEAPAAPPAAVDHGPLVAPSAATAGQQITVRVRRNAHFCGPTELRFDGAPAPAVPSGDGTSLTMHVPTSAGAGQHELQLYGPVAGGTAGPLCGDVRERQARLATVTITVLPRR